MNYKLSPEPPRYAVCANEGTPIKAFYKDYFQDVFIILHPFIKGEAHQEIISWKDFMILVGIDNYKQLDVALRTNILGLQKEKEDRYLALQVQKTCQKYKIVEPMEGIVPPILLNHLLQGIRLMGYEWMFVGDEFGTERKLTRLAKISETNQRLNYFTHDCRLLITTHWDSHFTLIGGDKTSIDNLIDFCNLEGFYCDDETEIYWSIK